MRKNPKLLNKKTSYKVLYDGEWSDLSAIYACCDCGLVHRQEFRFKSTDGNSIEWRMWRDKRRTSALRRDRKEAIQERLKLN